ncbi:hypothetical protein J6590_008421 [Homalodisca vitripennis]|nr:hypothetical protein J6590_008421 [Homalodisca vitripennis]
MHGKRFRSYSQLIGYFPVPRRGELSKVRRERAVTRQPPATAKVRFFTYHSWVLCNIGNGTVRSSAATPPAGVGSISTRQLASYGEYIIDLRAQIYNVNNEVTELQRSYRLEKAVYTDGLGDESKSLWSRLRLRLRSVRCGPAVNQFLGYVTVQCHVSELGPVRLRVRVPAAATAASSGLS